MTWESKGIHADPQPVKKLDEKQRELVYKLFNRMRLMESNDWSNPSYGKWANEEKEIKEQLGL